jgi:hypothetical protein
LTSSGMPAKLSVVFMGLLLSPQSNGTRFLAGVQFAPRIRPRTEE